MADNNITQLNHLSNNIFELSIFAERANFMIGSLLNTADESTEEYTTILHILCSLDALRNKKGA